MKKEFRVYLEDIKESITQIEKYTKDLDFEKFSEKAETQDAVMRRLAIIGEAAKNLPEEIKAKYSEIPWPEIAGMRNVLITNMRA